MWIRIDGRDRKAISYAIANSPAPASEWILRELAGKVDRDAISIAFGFFSRSEGTTSVDNVWLEFFD